MHAIQRLPRPGVKRQLTLAEFKDEQNAMALDHIYSDRRGETGRMRMFSYMLDKRKREIEEERRKEPK